MSKKGLILSSILCLLILMGCSLLFSLKAPALSSVEHSIVELPR